ncbi:MAG: hypothetical protein RRA92_09655 [Gemmatimonadota bacterium]|nr:hypothetical protein [Gemmatimonadota bacterium]
MRIARSCVTAGAVGGILAASAIVVLFFFADLARGEPLGTVHFLADSFLETGSAAPGPVAIGIYTVLHFAVFTLLGILAAIGFDVTGIPRSPLLGATAGLFFCSLIFYPALALVGSEILTAPAWPLIFAGNMIAGIVIVGWLRRSEARRKWKPSVSLDGTDVLREGVLVGLLGAAAVAVWFLVVDSVAGRPLFTPAALGSVLLYGVDAASHVTLSATTVLAYSLLHVTAFVLLGVISAALVVRIEQFPPLLFAFVMLFVIYWTFVVFLTTMLGTWLLRELAWWSVFAGNLLAAVVMGGYLLKAHPRLVEGLTDEALWDPN